MTFWASWDAEKALGDVKDWVVARLGEANGILVLNETGDLKKDATTAGVQRQYTGTTDQGHALIDRALYLPRCWTEDEQRMIAAGVPEDTVFATKPARAQTLISSAQTAGVPAR